MPEPRRLIIGIAIMIAIGLLLAVLGPFGTFGVPFAVRLAYWLVLMLSGYGLFLPAIGAASRAAERLALPDPAMWAAATALASIPMTVVVHFVTGMIGRTGPVTLDSAIELYSYVLVVAALACTVIWFSRASRTDRASPGSDAPLSVTTPPPHSDAVPTPAFLDRLPPHLGRDLRALEMEDHYVRAHTVHGSAMILMRMRDAVAELGGVEGAQVHRSWWVARAAVTGIRRDGRNMRLKLGDTLEAPVARGSVDDLEARGWF